MMHGVFFCNWKLFILNAKYTLFSVNEILSGRNLYGVLRVIIHLVCSKNRRRLPLITHASCTH